MTLKFSKKEIIEAVIAHYPPSELGFKQCLEFELTGQLLDGTAFTGKDVVRIQFKINGNSHIFTFSVSF